MLLSVFLVSVVVLVAAGLGCPVEMTQIQHVHYWCLIMQLILDDGLLHFHQVLVNQIPNRIVEDETTNCGHC